MVTFNLEEKQVKKEVEQDAKDPSSYVIDKRD